MITQRDLEEAIAECQGVRNPDSSVCIKLAAFYTIKNELFPPQKEEPIQLTGSSFKSVKTAETVQYDGDSETADLINGMTVERLCEVFDELMGSLQVVEPRLYAAVVRKLRE